MSETYINNNFNDIIKYANAIEKRLDDSDFTLAEALQENQFYHQKCIEFGLDFIMINDKYNIEITF